MGGAIFAVRAKDERALKREVERKLTEARNLGLFVEARSEPVRKDGELVIVLKLHT